MSTRLDVGPIVEQAIRNELDRRRADLGPLFDVYTERARQDAKWGEQNHPDGTDPNASWPLSNGVRRDRARDAIRSVVDTDAANGLSTWSLILLEEVAEALAEDDPAKLRNELIQAATVCVQWVQAIDRRHP